MTSISALLLLFASVQAYHDPQFYPNRSGIVHLFEWPWNSIAEECERYLGPKGFAGVQVSPVQENVVIPGRPWFERYQPQSYLLTTRSGTRDQFKEMVARCNKSGIRIYVDVVFNHMAAFQGLGTGGSVSNISLLDFRAVPFSASNFNQNCDILDYKNATQVRNCWLVGLPDLDQSQELVRIKIADFLNDLIDLGVTGFRVDAAKHMWPRDLENIYGRLKNLNTNFGFSANQRPFLAQEVIDLGGEAVSK